MCGWVYACVCTRIYIYTCVCVCMEVYVYQRASTISLSSLLQRDLSPSHASLILLSMLVFSFSLPSKSRYPSPAYMSRSTHPVDLSRSLSLPPTREHRPPFFLLHNLHFHLLLLPDRYVHLAHSPPLPSRSLLFSRQPGRAHTPTHTRARNVHTDASLQAGACQEVLALTSLRGRSAIRSACRISSPRLSEDRFGNLSGVFGEISAIFRAFPR